MSVHSPLSDRLICVRMLPLSTTSVVYMALQLTTTLRLQKEQKDAFQTLGRSNDYPNFNMCES